MSTMNVPVLPSGTPYGTSQDQQQPQQPQTFMYPGPVGEENQGMVKLEPLRKQIEFYFSKQNLATDKFLQSQLNATEHLGAVSIGILCSFPKVRQLHALIRNMGHLPPQMTPMADPVLVRLALQDSEVVKVSPDGAWVMLNEFRSLLASPEETSTNTDKVQSSAPSSPSSQTTGSSSLGIPTHPLPPSAQSARERNTVIVRDVPAEVKAEEVQKVFSTDSVTPKAVRPDVGNTWFVTFGTEEEAVEALTASRDRELQGVPVRGHLKSDMRPRPQQPQPVPAPQSTTPPVPESTASVGGNSAASSGPRQPAAAPQPYPVMPGPYGMPMPYGHMGNYGYVPYPGFNMQQQAMAMRMQQQYFQQGYNGQGHPYMGQQGPYRQNNPPPHVYVRPNQRGGPPPKPNSATEPQQGNKKNKKKKHKKQNRQQQQQQPQDSAQGGPPQDRPGRNGKNKSGQTEKAPPQSKKDPKIDLGAENFPALGGGAAPKPEKAANAPVVAGGYAQALLKKPKANEKAPGDATPGSSDEK